MGKLGRVIVIGVIAVGVLSVSGVKVFEYFDSAKNYVMNNEQVQGYIKNNLDVAEKLQDLSKDSKTVKYDAKTNKVQVFIIDQWVPISNITKVSDFDGKSCKVTIDGNEYSITDSDIITLLNMLKK